MRTTHGSIVAWCAAALLSGCGGGGSGAPAPSATDAVPASASESALGLKAYLLALSTMLVDDREPLDLSGFSPKTPDDVEPEAVD